MNEIKLWVDDIRPAPPGWELARSISEAIRILDTMNVTEVSLDYDISMKVSVGNVADGFSGPRPFRSNETFEPVARFIAMILKAKDNGSPNVWLPMRITIHTANIIGQKKMLEILRYHPNVLAKLSDPCNRFEE